MEVIPTLEDTASCFPHSEVLELQAELRAGKIEVGCAVCHLATHNWGCPKMGVPKNGWFILDYPIKMIRLKWII